MSQVSDQRGWKDRDLTEHKNWGKPEKKDDLGSKQTSVVSDTRV